MSIRRPSIVRTRLRAPGCASPCRAIPAEVLTGPRPGAVPSGFAATASGPKPFRDPSGFAASASGPRPVRHSQRTAASTSGPKPLTTPSGLPRAPPGRSPSAAPGETVGPLSGPEPGAIPADLPASRLSPFGWLMGVFYARSERARKGLEDRISAGSGSHRVLHNVTWVIHSRAGILHSFLHRSCGELRRLVQSTSPPARGRRGPHGRAPQHPGSRRGGTASRRRGRG